MKSQIYVLLITGCLAVFMTCQRNPIKKWIDVVNDHLQIYPEMRPDDIYKLVYQGMLGPGHLGNDRGMIAKYLVRELSEIEPDPDADLEEVISPDSTYIRINLKKLKSLGLPKESLVDAIVRSVEKAPNSKSDFIDTWQSITKQVDSGKIKIDKQVFSRFNQFITKNNYPVIHHSEIYTRTYRPAYRVVLRSVWKSVRNSR